MLTPPRSQSESSSSPSSRPVAYATLLTTDSYLDAALTLARSLRNTSTPYRLLALVDSTAVSEQTIQRLQHPSRQQETTPGTDRFFDEVIPVEPIHGISASNLSLIGRPELASTLTKIQLWNLADRFERILYLDADTLVLANVDHLFDLPSDVDFAAAPELGFPDCFNAGVMLLRPDTQTHAQLLDLSKKEQSFDGGDQGILNTFFGDGTVNHPFKSALKTNTDTTDQMQVQGSTPPSAPASNSAKNWFRLSYTYNMEMHQVYRMYIPAVLRYRSEHKILHFIGKDKPWNVTDGKGKMEVPEDASAYYKFYVEMVEKWWEVRRTVPS